jgi:hypothetical protein
VLSFTPLLSRAALWLANYSFLTSWTYLRFFKVVFPDLDSAQPSSLRGDASETFAFAEFFPGPVKPFVAALADPIYNILVVIRLCKPASQRGITAGRDSFQHRGAPGSARAEAERRRAIALKALDQRLNAATAASRPSAPAPPPASAQPSGPPVQVQPQTSAQTAMKSEPGPMLGETKFEPEEDDS